MCDKKLVKTCFNKSSQRAQTYLAKAAHYRHITRVLYQVGGCVKVEKTQVSEVNSGMNEVFGNPAFIPKIEE